MATSLDDVMMIQNSPGSGAEGTLRAFGSSDLVRLNNDTKAVDSNPTNPYANNQGTIAVATPRNARFLDLYHIHRGSSNPSTALQIRAYGLSRKNALLKGKPDFPRNRDAAFELVDEIWLPLYDPDATDIQAALEFNSTPALVNGNTLRISAPRKVFCAGCDAVIIKVSQAADVIDAGFIYGRVVYG